MTWLFVGATGAYLLDFFLLQYLVVFTVESLSFLYLLLFCLFGA